jgi:hypothetical protein
MKNERTANGQSLNNSAFWISSPSCQWRRLPSSWGGPRVQFARCCTGLASAAKQDGNDNRRRARRLENHHRLVRSRIGHDKQGVPRHIAPGATEAIFVPYKINWAFLDSFPAAHFNVVMGRIDDNHRTGRDHFTHGVIVLGDDPQTELP